MASGDSIGTKWEVCEKWGCDIHLDRHRKVTKISDRINVFMSLGLDTNPQYLHHDVWSL
jgi:hypothetical protein